MQSEPSRSDVIGSAIAEAIGTFLLVAFPTAVATEAASKLSIAGSPADSLAVATSFGVTLFVLVRIFAARSGANFNPAVTIGLLLHKQISSRIASIYIGAQLFGAILGAAMVRLLFVGTPQATGFGVTQPAHGVNFAIVMLAEFVGTVLLTLAIAAVALSKQAALDAAITIGAALMAIVLFAGPLTGGAFNPARALGPMLLNGEFKDWWAYLIAEFAGGYAGIALYLRYFKKVEAPAE